VLERQGFDWIPQLVAHRTHHHRLAIHGIGHLIECLNDTGLLILCPPKAKS
jgi:hypothetical protein